MIWRGAEENSEMNIFFPHDSLNFFPFLIFFMEKAFKPIQMHYAVPDVVRQQEARV